MTVNNQIELKRRANRDAGIKKSWRELENKYSPRDFRLGEKGWKCDKTTVWYEGEPPWQEN